MLAGAGTQRFPVSGFVSPATSNSTISILATDGGGGTAGLQLFVANWHRLGSVERFSCNKALGHCVPDHSGSYTDEALCNANCGHATAVLADANPLQDVTLTIR